MDIYITKLQNLLSQDSWTESDICYTMVNFRAVLERHKLKEKFKTLNLYCNWTLHTSIQESIYSYRVLERITESMVFYEAGDYSEGRFSDAVIEAISFHLLFEEIISLGKMFNIESVTKFDNLDHCWSFSGPLLLILLGKPIMITKESLIKSKKLEGITKTIFHKGELAGNAEKYSITGFSFVVYKNKIHWRIFTKYSVKNKINLLGKFILTNQELIDQVRQKWSVNNK